MKSLSPTAIFDSIGNMKKSNIILTGFMGTGKSSTGRLLARKLGYEFIDTDQLIQTRQQLSIPEIFAEQGEEAFRRMEAEAAAELATREGLVIATGGRLMLDADNAATLGNSGIIFCLTADIEELILRLSSETARKRRPLLQNCDNLSAYVRKLLAERSPAYQHFQQIDTTGKKPYQIAAMLAYKIRNKYQHKQGL